METNEAIEIIEHKILTEGKAYRIDGDERRNELGTAMCVVLNRLKELEKQKILKRKGE